MGLPEELNRLLRNSGIDGLLGVQFVLVSENVCGERQLNVKVLLMDVVRDYGGIGNIVYAPSHHHPSRPRP